MEHKPQAVQLDDLARMMAGDTSRRSVLRALVGIATATLLGGATSEGAEAKRKCKRSGRSCNEDKPKRCCSKICCQGTCCKKSEVCHSELGCVVTSISDRNAKTGFSPVDPRDVLDRVISLPIESWRYRAEPDSGRHIGPMAQDFHAAFGLGADDRHIFPLDGSGVALSAIQGLYDLVQAQETRLAAQERRLEHLARRNAELEARMSRTTLTVAEHEHGLICRA